MRQHNERIEDMLQRTIREAKRDAVIATVLDIGLVVWIMFALVFFL